MKKALIVLLILAVAGGLFAQTLKFSGNVQTGLAIGFDDRDGDAGKPKVDYIRNRGEHGIRGDLVMQFYSADDAAYGTYGAEVRFRVRQNNILDKNADVGIAPRASDVFLFWNPSSILWLQLGTAGGAGWGTMGGVDRDFGILDGNGLKARLSPIPGLDIVGHAYYGTALKNFEDMNLGFGARYKADNLVTVLANMRYYGSHPNADLDADRRDSKMDLGAGVNLTMLSNLGFNKIALDVGTTNLGGDGNFFLGFGPAIGFGVGDLSLGAKAKILLWMGDGDADVTPMLFSADASYKVGITKIGAEARYGIGSVPSFSNYRNATEDYDVGIASFKAKDTSGFNISPYVSFAVGPEIILGYNLRMDLSKDAKDTKGKSLEHLIYAGVNMSF